MRGCEFLLLLRRKKVKTAIQHAAMAPKRKVLREQNTNVNRRTATIQRDPHRTNVLAIFSRCQESPVAHSTGIRQLQRIYEEVGAFCIVSVYQSLSFRYLLPLLGQ